MSQQPRLVQADHCGKYAAAAEDGAQQNFEQAVKPHTEIEIAHLLDPLTDLGGIDTVWLLWAPTHLVQWSTVDQRWLNLIFAGSDRPDDPDLRLDSFELLQDVEKKLLHDIGHTAGSPYLFILGDADDEAATDN